MATYRVSKINDSISKESISLKENRLRGTLSFFSGQQGEYWVCIVPSLNVSGYGINENDAFENLKENIELFCKDLFSLNMIQRKIELKNLGWVQDKYFNKKYKTPFVDENGVLQNFDFPEKVTRKILEAAA